MKGFLGFFKHVLVKAKIPRFSCSPMELADLDGKELAVTGSIQEKDASLFVRNIVEGISVLCDEITSTTPLHFHKEFSWSTERKLL